MVGNGATDFMVDVSPSFPQTVYNFNLITKDLYDTIEGNNCFYSFNGVIPYNNSLKCDKAWEQIQNLTGDLNWYDLYRPVYPDSALVLKAENRLGEALVDGEVKTYKRGFTIEEYTPWMKRVSLKSPLLGDFVSDYVNNADTRKAMNIPSDMPGWDSCSNTLQYHSQVEGSIWIYPVLRNKMRIMFYSGDTDGAVPTYGSRQWIQNLNWKITNQWRPWFTPKGQVAGYVENHDGLDFITVHGVGHMAPQWARQSVTDMITEWIHKKE